MTLTETDSKAGVLPVDLSPGRLAALGGRLVETAEETDRTAAFPWEGLRHVHRAGILTATVGERYGGRGLGAVEAVTTFHALGAGDPAVALISLMTVFQHAAQAANPFWPEALYADVLADSVGRPVLLNAVRAEPELGAPARGGLPATTLRRTATGWVLNGHKAFATGAEGLAHHLVWAVTEEPEPRIGHVIVTAGTPGVTIVPTWDHLGLRASSTHDVLYTDVEVDADRFVGVPVGSVPNNQTRGDGLPLAISALYLGVARSAQDWFVRFANERIPTALGAPIATTERIQSVAGEIEANLVQAEELLWSLAAKIDAAEARGDVDPVTAERSGLAKLLVSRAAITAVQTAVAAIGNPGLTRGNPLERHLRDVLCSRPHPPQDDAALLLAGRRSLARVAAVVGGASRAPVKGASS